MFELQNKSYQELVQEAAAVNPEQANNFCIQKSELDVLQFFLRDGKEITRQYLQKIVEVPPHAIASQLQDELFNMVYTFVDLSMAPDQAKPLKEQVLAAPNFAAIVEMLKAQQNNHRALVWLAECLLELPMNIFTDDEKRSIVRKVI